MLLLIASPPSFSAAVYCDNGDADDADVSGELSGELDLVGEFPGDADIIGELPVDLDLVGELSGDADIIGELPGEFPGDAGEGGD